MFRRSFLRLQMYTGTTAAGKSFARKHVGRIPKWNMWRSFVKLMSVPQAHVAEVCWGDRLVRTLFKMVICFAIYSYPMENTINWLQPFVWFQAWTDGDERWKNNPSMHLMPLEHRMFSDMAIFYMYDDPWRVYAPAYNQIPWYEWTRDDNPDMERGWSAFGMAYPCHISKGHLKTVGAKTYCINDMQSAGRGTGGGSGYDGRYAFIPFVNFLKGWNVMFNDTYYNAVSAWQLPIDERGESIGKPRWWRRFLQWRGCCFGIANMDPWNGAVSPWQYYVHI